MLLNVFQKFQWYQDDVLDDVTTLCACVFSYFVIVTYSDIWDWQINSYIIRFKIMALQDSHSHNQ